MDGFSWTHCPIGNPRCTRGWRIDWHSTWSRIILRVNPCMDFLGHVVPYVLSVIPEFDGLVSRSRWATRIGTCTYLSISLVGHCCKLQLILLDFDWHSTWSRIILRVNPWMHFIGHVVPYVSVVCEFDGLVSRSRWATRVIACTYLCIWLVGHCCKLQLILLDFDWHSTWSRIILRVNPWMNFLGYVVAYVLSVVSEFDRLDWHSTWSRIILRMNPWMDVLGHVVQYVLSVIPEFDGLVSRSRWATRVSACTYLCIWLVGHCCKLQLILLDFDWHSTWSRIIWRVNPWMNFLGHVVPYVLSVVCEFDGLVCRSRWATMVSACPY